MNPDFIGARDFVSSALRRELVGPSPQGKELDCAGDIKFPNWDAAAGPFRQKETGEEILTGDRPVKRYGIGVLYPIGLAAEDLLTRHKQHDQKPEINEYPFNPMQLLRVEPHSWYRLAMLHQCDRDTNRIGGNGHNIGKQ